MGIKGAFPLKKLKSLKIDTTELIRVPIPTIFMLFLFFPELTRVYAASPIGNSSPSSSINFFLKIYERKAPSMLPVNIVKKRSILSISFKFPPESRYPGRVNATPPATIEPALMIV